MQLPFEHVYVINLDRRPDRLKQITQQLDALGIAFERVSAVDGLTLGSRFKALSRQQRGYGGMTGPNVLGCHLSHIHCYEDALAKGYRSILILEDDARFHKRFSELFPVAMAAVPLNWLMLQLGDMETVGARPKTKLPFHRMTRGSFGNFALALKAEILSELLDGAKSLRWRNDNLVCEQIRPRFPDRCFVLWPNLVIQGWTCSDLRSDKAMQQWPSRFGWQIEDYAESSH